MDRIAVGAFDGSDGLPSDGAQLAGPDQFEDYVAALKAKTTEVSADALQLTISGVYGHYVVLGGSGGDVVTANSPDAVPSSGFGEIWGRDGDDNLTGGSGNDILAPGAGADTVDGGDGQDTVSYFDAAVGVHVDLTKQAGPQDTGVGAQVLYNFEAVTGSDHDDLLVGDTGNNTLSAGAGNDTIESGGGQSSKVLDGGDGVDTLSYVHADRGVAVNLGAEDQNTGYDYVHVSNIENLVGSDLADELTGADLQSNLIEGMGGDDVIFASFTALVFDGGDGDTLDGGEGVDSVSFNSGIGGGGGAFTIDLAEKTAQMADGSVSILNFEAAYGSAWGDTLIGDSGDNTLNGGEGDDTIDGASGGKDVLVGDTGRDVLTYAKATVGVTVNLNLTPQDVQDTGVGEQKIDSLDDLIGSKFDDHLTGRAWHFADGGAGDDTLAGGEGSTLDGGAGSDTASFAAAADGVQVNLQSQNVYQMAGSAGLVYLTGIENLQGGDFNDLLVGNADANKLLGGGGDDMLLAGDGGADTVNGGAGANEVNTANYEAAAVGVTVDLAQQGAGQETGVGLQVLTNIQALIGSMHDDVLSGGAGTVSLDGNNGNDTINGAGGAASLSGGAQTDFVSYAGAAVGVTVNLALQNDVQFTGVGQQTLSWFENLAGSSHDDKLTGDGGFNLILGGAGDDTVVASWGADTLQGGAGVDTVDFSAAWNSVAVDLGKSGAYETGIGNQIIKAFENVTGSTYSDRLVGSAGANLLKGGDGWDTLVGGGGADTLVGGGDYDTVSYQTATTGVHVSLLIQDRVQNTGDGKQVLSGIEAVEGSDFADVLTGLGHYSTVFGGKGDDTLHSGGGTGDTLQGGDGDDVLVFTSEYDRAFGGDGRDTLVFDAALKGVSVDLVVGRLGFTGEVYDVENVVGTAGADRLVGDSDANHLSGGKGADTLDGGTGADTLEGGGGLNTVSYASAPGVTVSLAAQGSAQDTGHGLQVLSGFRNLEGSFMNDALTGDQYANRIDGSFGDDVVTVSAGDDTLVGGDGSDTLSFAGSAKGVTIDLDSAGPQATASGTLIVSGFETLVGSAKADNLSGGFNPNLIVAGAGADHVWGGDGNDTLVSGGDGDVLSGGIGIDYFTYADMQKAALGQIIDLDPNDFIDLTGAAHALGLTQFTEVARFHAVAGEVKVQFDAAANQTAFLFDTDGDKKGDHTLLVDGDHRDFTAFIGVDVSGMAI